MYKSNTELIVIDAKATEPIPTNVVFWSHDKGTAKMLFQLQKDYVNQTLSEGTIVPICLDFVGGRHIYHAVIEDAVNGIVSIVLEDNILGYQGRVDGSIYIELPDSRSLDTAGRFTFDIKRSPIDLNTPELEDYYWQGFGEIMNQYHQTIAEIETESERLLNELQARILTLEEKLDDVELRARFKTAWSWSADGTDRFTTVYPNENILANSKDYSSKWSFSNAALTEILEADGTPTKIIKFNFNPNGWVGMYQHYSNLSVRPKTGDIVTLSFYAKGNGAIYAGMEGITGVINAKATTEWKLYNLTGVVSEDIDNISMYLSNAVNTATSIYVHSVKLEINDEPTIYTPAPSEDPINAYPQYKGISIADSDNPADYSWQAEDNTIAKKATLDSHTENISNPHKVTKTQIGLGNVDNYSTATQAEAEAGTDNTKAMTPLRTKQLLDAKLLNMVYPIGSIYMSVNSATPATLFGGTWERFSKGRVLVGVDEDDAALKTAGTNGGSTNPLTAHTHTTQLTTYRVTSTGSGAVNNLARSTDQGNAMTGEFGSVTSSGDNTDHKNWQPFDTVYIWKRTA